MNFIEWAIKVILASVLIGGIIGTLEALRQHRETIRDLKSRVEKLEQRQP